MPRYLPYSHLTFEETRMFKEDVRAYPMGEKIVTQLGDLRIEVRRSKGMLIEEMFRKWDVKLTSHRVSSIRKGKQ